MASAVYYIDDGGSESVAYGNWASGANSLKALYSYVSGINADGFENDTVYVGHDSIDDGSDWTGGFTVDSEQTPNSNVTRFISATQGSNPPTYQKATTTQIYNDAGGLTFNNTIEMYGIKLDAAGYITITDVNSQDRQVKIKEVTFLPGDTYTVRFINQEFLFIDDLEINLSNDTTDDNTNILYYSGYDLYINDLSITNGGYRTGSIIYIDTAISADITNIDISSCTNVVTPALLDTPYYGNTTIHNVLTDSTWLPFSNTRSSYYSGNVRQSIYNAGPSSNKTYFAERTIDVDLYSSTSIYRSNGALVEGTNTSWLLTTESTLEENRSYYGPWIYFDVSATGSTDFSIHIVNDIEDFTKDEICLQLEVPMDGHLNQFATTEQDITAASATYPVDSVSVWNGTGPSFTYPQKLTVTKTVGATGRGRGRIKLNKPSIGSSGYFYIDPYILIE